MSYTFITTNEALQTFCVQASNVPAIAVDTEFVRTRTLYPQIGLIQIYDGHQLVLVDPLAITDFTSLKELLVNPNVVKVLHSCSEDLETFWHALKVMPEPIFDTQFAASIVGMGASLGYAKLVEVMLDIKVDKGESRTNWLARPLRVEQCDYAAKDVLYLFQLYPELKQRTVEQDKLLWVFDEISTLANKKKTNVPLDMVYLGFKHNWQLQGKCLLTLQRLAAWRLETARVKDLALNFVIREQNLVEVARRQPKNKGELHEIEGLSPQEIRIHGEAMLDIVAESNTQAACDYPSKIERLTQMNEYKQTFAAVRQVCIEVAEKISVPVELVGSKKQINQLIKWCWSKQDETRAMGLIPD
ncbi:MAG: ribonuclease D, partial [Paraglaciecola sp.]